MATDKLITMKQFNETDYDTLYPKTVASQILDVYSKTNIITTETLSQFGLTADKLPNDAFQQIKALIDGVQSSVDGKPNIQTGSYVGTGTYGSTNPYSLTFDKIPDLVWVYARTNQNGNSPTSTYAYNCLTDTANGAYINVISPKLLSNNYQSGYGLGGYNYSSNIRLYAKKQSNTIYWYAEKTNDTSSNVSNFQNNDASHKYYYLAFFLS